MERKLASIQKVQSIEPITNADAIELARINGWQCVVKKGEFEVGDLGVFLEIDSVPPDDDKFRFLWQRRPKEGEPAPEVVERPGNFRLRTIKLRGTLSQGLLLPLGYFDLGEVSEGEDVTEKLGVIKYEPPVNAMLNNSEFRAPFPPLVPKTDEMRVQSIPEVLDEIRGLPYVATLKYDGSSSTYVLDPFTGDFHACSRNQSVLEGNSVYWRIARQYGLEAILRSNPDYAIQGEICGPGIQKNHLGLKDLELFVFNIYDFKVRRYLTHDEVQAWTGAHGLKAVAEIERGDSFEHSQESLLALAEGKYAGTSNEREGIVIRPLAETSSVALAGRLSFKAISNRFLLKESD
ncbi:RNA ligase (ATP) [bacterium]|nr:MAG: RNA ligase (ATP) [bacterium]